MGGQSKSQVVGYSYSLDAHFVFCAAPIDIISLIYFRDKKTIAWRNPNIQIKPQNIAVNSPSLFGGQSSQGGIVGNFNILYGSPDQGQNATLVNLQGSLSPAYRGVFSIVWSNVNVGMNPYLPTWGIRYSRIHKRISLDGITDRDQWYDSKSAISSGETAGLVVAYNDSNWLYKQVASGDVNDYSAAAYDDSAWSQGSAPFASAVHPYSAAYGYPAVVGTTWTLGTNLWLRRKLILDNNGTFTMSLYVDNWATVWINGTLVLARTGVTSTTDGHEFNHPTITIPSGAIIDGVNVIAIKCEDVGGNSYAAAKMAATISINQDMNPVHIMREFKTEPWSSARIAEAKLPDSVWQAAADTVYSEGLGMTFMYDGSQSIEAAMSEVARHIGAELYNDRKTGEFKIKLIRNDYNIATIPSFNESTIIDMSKEDTPVFGQLTTDVVVNYTDTANDFVEASITVQDIALAQQQGKRITANLDYKGFTNGTVAGRKAQQMLNTLSKPLQKRSFIVRMSAGKDLNKGDVFKFSWARENIVDMVMRITDMNFGNGISNRIKIDAIQDEFAMPTSSFIAPPTSDWTPPFSEPTSLTDRLILEAPYLELVQLGGQSIVDLQLSNDVNSSYVLAAVGSQTNSTKAMLYDGVSTYDQVGIVDFCPTATLNAACGLLDTTLTITGGKLLDQVAIGTWFQLDNELMRVDAISDTSMTVGRGCLDTIPATHSIGAVLHFWDNASLTDSTEFVTGNTVNAKLLTINPKGQLDINDAPVDSITMVGRAARPYNMANVKINGGYYTSSVTGGLVLTWANRNRLQQTSGTIYSFKDGNITPESGVTYSISVLDRDGTVGYSVTGVTGTTATILTSDLIGCDDQATLKIVAVRSGITSYQTYLIPFTNTNSKLRITTTTSPRVTTGGTFRRVT